MDPPTMRDVLVDIAVRTQKREAAIYYGYTAFFIRLSTCIQELVFAFIHTLTDFIESVTSYKELIAQSATPDLTLLGVRLLAAIIPALIVLITILISGNGMISYLM